MLWEGGHTHLWHQVIASKYGEGNGGWYTRAVRGTHGYGMWKNIRKGVRSFFVHVLYAAGKGFCIWFWHDPWSSPTHLKELYPELFACAVDKEARIFDMVDIAPNVGDRS